MNLLNTRFSLRSLLIVVVLLGLALGVVAWNSEWMAATCYAAFLLIQCAAIVGAFSRTGSARVFWLAIVVFGFGYGLSAFPSDRSQSYWPFILYRVNPSMSGNSPVGPADVMDRLFRLIEPTARVGDEVMARYQSGGVYAATVQDIQSDGRILVAWHDRTPASWVSSVSIENVRGRVAGHSVMAILVALLAAYACQAAFTPTKESMTVTSDHTS